MSEWKEYKLGEISKFSQGIQVPVEEQQSTNFQGAVRFIRIVDYTNNDPKDIRYIADPGSKYIVEVDDLVMIRYGSQTAGKIARGLRGVIANNTFKISPDEELLFKGFLFYFLSQNTIYDYFRNSQSSSTMPAITFGQIGDLKIKFPSLKTQITIAEILSSIDDKIELNNKINEELESLAQTFLKQWFIDFEFPNENGEPYKSSGGEMTDSELGEIPKGWEITQIGDVCDLISGYPFKGDKYVKSGDYGIVTIKNVQDGRFIQDTENYINEFPSKFPDSLTLKIGDILMSLTGNVGRVCYVTKENCLLNQRVVKLNGYQKNSNSLWYYFFRQTTIKNTLISISKGTAQLNLSPIETKSLKIIFPKKIDENILGVFNEIFNNQVSCSMENNELTNLRNFLLPKFISGEIEINEINN